jgi:KaiC/GvpD/RAD55 family RecA-like ATPase
MAAMARHVRGIQRAGGRVLYVTADRSHHILREAFGTQGVDLADIYWLDAITAVADNLPRASKEDNTMYIASPTMLEMIAMRTEQLAYRTGAHAHVVLDSLNALCLYNDPRTLQEFTHYLANRLKLVGVAADFVVRPNRQGQEMLERLRGFVDTVAALEVTA